MPPTPKHDEPTAPVGTMPPPRKQEPPTAPASGRPQPAKPKREPATASRAPKEDKRAGIPSWVWIAIIIVVGVAAYFLGQGRG